MNIKWKVEVLNRPSRYLLLIHKHVADNGDAFDDEIRGQIECESTEERDQWLEMVKLINERS